MTVGDTSPTPTPVDKSKLNTAVGDAAKLAEKDYTKDSWAPFAKALADAKTVAGKQDASQADVDAAVKALADAQSGLKKAETVPRSQASRTMATTTSRPTATNRLQPGRLQVTRRPIQERWQEAGVGQDRR